MSDDTLNELLGESMDRAKVLRLGAATLILPTVAGGLAGRAFAAGGPVDTSKYKTKPPWRVGRAGAGDVNDWMIFLSAHYEYKIKRQHKNLFKDYIVTSANFDPTKQVNDVEDLLSQDIDLLFIEPTSLGGLSGAVSKAIAFGVPVVLVSTRVTGNKGTTLVSRNNYRDGVIKARWLAQKLKGRGKIVALMGFAGSSYAQDVWAGCKKTLKSYPGIEVLEMQNANWSAPTAKKVTETFLVKYEQIDGILSDGGQMALGAVRALQDANRPIPPITADDWNGWMRAASKIPKLQFYAISGSANLSSIGVELGIKVLQGKPVPRLQDAPFETWDQRQLKRWFRPDLADAYWGFHSLPESFLRQKFKKK